MRRSELPNLTTEDSLALVLKHSLDMFALMFSCSIILIESNQTHVAHQRNQIKTQQASTTNLSMGQISGRIKMSSTTILLLLLLLVELLLDQQTKLVNGSGVFELELIKLEPIESLNRLQQHDNSSSARTTNLTDTTREEQASGSSNGLVKILVCLKEPFTSQLDGPCTFGNSSITLNRNSQNERQELGANTSASSNTTTLATNITNVRHEHQGSQMTNIVRILFTFRWTKAFTIILTTEELQTEAAGGTTTAPTAAVAAAGVRLTTTTTSTTTTVAPPAAAERSDLSSTNGSGRQATNGTIKTKSGIIDRHILTENEVLPNLEPNPNKPWASRFSRSLKSSLAYRFRVYCSLNYYGDGCTTFCRPRDDQFGHYNCSSTGQKICHEGWHGPECDKARCRAGCNQQYGFCQQPETCQCRPGWTGPRCDECITYPGCQNGYCLSAWQCICRRNWGGVMCDQDLNFCGTHEPCKNNGTCQNIAPDRYKCSCPEGFTGSDCEISVSSLSMQQGCALNPCLNGGTCYGFNTDMLLADNKDTAESLDSSSSFDINSYRCQCAPGWTGDFCQWSDLPSNFLFTDNTSVVEKSTTGTSPATTATTIESNTLQTSIEHETVTLNSKALKSIIENAPLPSRSIPFSNMNYLISWIVGATILGVLLAFCTLAWCCFMAIKRNRFSFIQMNIIRSSDGSGQTALRRMHEKIRDSLRRTSRSRIKPETKLSIENVLRPPPSYDESNTYHALNKISLECAPSTKESIEDMEQGAISKSNSYNLVIRGALEKKLSSTPSLTSSSKSSSTVTSEQSEENVTKVPVISEAKLKCPRHGQLYRQQQCQHQRTTNSNHNINVIDYYHTSHLYHDPPPDQQSTSYH